MISIQPTESRFVRIHHPNWGLDWRLQFPEMVRCADGYVMNWQKVTPKMVNNAHPDSVILSDIKHVTFDPRLGPGKQRHIMASFVQTTTSQQNILLSATDDQPGYELNYSHVRYFTTETQPEEVPSAKHFHKPPRPIRPRLIKIPPVSLPRQVVLRFQTLLVARLDP